MTHNAHDNRAPTAPCEAGLLHRSGAEGRGCALLGVNGSQVRILSSRRLSLLAEMRVTLLGATLCNGLSDSTDSARPREDPVHRQGCCGTRTRRSGSPGWSAGGVAFALFRHGLRRDTQRLDAVEQHTEANRVSLEFAVEPVGVSPSPA
jgi:hypothetical protein